jgi:hypothetical protein
MLTKVTIKTRNVGQNFGCYGVVAYASNGKVIHKTQTRPYGFDSSARYEAENWALDMGYIPVSGTESHE